MKFITNSVILVFTLLKTILSQNQSPENQAKQVEIPDLPWEDLPGRKITNFHQDIERLSNSSDMTFFLYIYHTESPHAKKAIFFIKNIAKRLDNIVEFIHYDCTGNPEDIEVCRKQPNTDGFPRMIALVPPEFRVNPYTKQPNYHSQVFYDQRNVNELYIYNFITKNIVSHSKKLDASNIDDFLSTDNINKVILFTDKKTTPLLYRGVSNVFFDRILFGEVPHTETRLLKRFGISKMPVLINFITIDDNFIPYQEPMIELYTDKNDANTVLQFVSRHALREKRWITRNKGLPLAQRSLYKNTTLDRLESVAEEYARRRVVIHLSEEGEISQQTLRLFNQLNGYFVFVNVNCRSKLLECMEKFGVKDFENLVLLPPGEDFKNRLLNSTTLGKNHKDMMFDFVSLYKSELKETHNQTVSSFSFEARRTNKFPIFYIYQEEEYNPAMYLIASEEKFTKHFDFILLKNPHEEIKKQLRVTTMPKVLLLWQNIGDENLKNIQIMALDGEITYLTLQKFANTLIQKIVNRKNSTDVEIEYTTELPEDVAFINDTRAFRTHCSRKKKPCLIAFLDGRSNQDSMREFERNFEQLDRIMNLKRSEKFSIMWINATCQTNFALKFNVQPDFLPSAIIYLPKQGLYSIMIGTFESENIRKFMDDFTYGNSPQYSVALSDADFKRIACENLKEETEKEEDDPILKEIIEEERRKREQFEKERQEAMKKKTTKKSKKSKSEQAKTDL